MIIFTDLGGVVKMGQFNLIDEPWISVIDNTTEEQRLVSMKDLFINAQDYRCLAGDTETQNFSVLRVLLAVLQTVFSRYDAEGKPYGELKINDLMQQTSDIDRDEDEEYYDSYPEAMDNTWKSLWTKKRFSPIVVEYLDCWKERFYLFDKKFPFYQVPINVIEKSLPEGKSPSVIAGRFLNRTISESGNKIALFAPRTSQTKDLMSEAELVRWLITYQNYTGLSDKASLVTGKQKPSKGWIFDIGGLYLEGNNLFETLMLNYLPYKKASKYWWKKQQPCWEFTGEEVINRLIKGRPIYNLAELYTNWSRAVYLNPDMDTNGSIFCSDVKLPSIAHDSDLEPMTIWRRNKTGDFKDLFTPQKHEPEQAMWRSFGLITLQTSQDENHRQPEILQQYKRVKKYSGNRWIRMHAVSMQDDGNATSWLPVDEIKDSLNLNDIVISDENPDGWVIRINEIVELSKKVVDITYYGLLKDIAEIRNMDPKISNGYISREKQLMYQRLDKPFRKWLEKQSPSDKMDDAMKIWKKELRSIVLDQAQSLVKQSNGRDFIGKEVNGYVKNIATVYLSFMGRLKQILGEVD